MKAIAYFVAYCLACLAGIFVLAFAFFWFSDMLIQNRSVNYGLLAQDTFDWSVKICGAAMIVYAIGYFVKKPKGGK